MTRNNGLTGTHQTPEHIKNRMKSLIKNGLYERMIGNKYCLGRRHSEISKEKMRIKALAARASQSEEVKAKTLKNLDRTGSKNTEETKIKMSESHKKNGTGKWMIGRKLPQPTLNKMSESQRLRYKNGFKNPMLGRTLTREHREKIGASLRGKKYGGNTELSLSIRMLVKYKDWRNNIFKRDNYICVQCGYSKGGIIEADHIVALAELILKNNLKDIEDAMSCEELWNKDNGRTLCKPCHQKTENYGRRRHQINNGP